MGLAKTFPGLTTTEDPIMKDGRMGLRDPTGPMDHMVKKPEKTYTHRFDEMEGTFINDVRVSLEEYNAFLKMSEKERIEKYGVYRRGGERLSAEEIKQINNWNNLTKEQKEAFLPLDINSVKAKNNQEGNINGVSKQASYEKPVVVVEGSGGGTEVIAVNEVTPSKVVPVNAGGSSNNESEFDINYMGG